MKTSSLSLVDIQLDERISSHSSRLKVSLDRRIQGVVTPNANLRLIGVPKREKDRLILSISSWWLKDQGILIRLELENSKDMLVRLACSSKTAALEIINSHYSERDFFGNFLPRAERLLSSIDFAQVKQRSCLKLVRRRGYNDHGTLRPEHRKHRNENDFSLVQLQNTIEEMRQSQDDTDQFLLGLMGIF